MDRGLRPSCFRLAQFNVLAPTDPSQSYSWLLLTPLLCNSTLHLSPFCCARDAQPAMQHESRFLIAESFRLQWLRRDSSHRKASQEVSNYWKPFRPDRMPLPECKEAHGEPHLTTINFGPRSIHVLMSVLSLVYQGPISRRFDRRFCKSPPENSSSAHPRIAYLILGLHNSTNALRGLTRMQLLLPLANWPSPIPLSIHV